MQVKLYIRTLFVFILLVFACRTVARNEDYRYPYRLWVATVHARPTNWRGWNNLGGVYYDQGNYKFAKIDFIHSLKLKSDQFEAWFNLGLIYHLEGDAEKAIMCYKNALAVNPSQKDARGNLDILLKSSLKKEE